MLKNFIDTKKLSSTVVLLRKFPHICIYTTLPTKHARACQQQDSFILQDIFFLYFLTDIYQISQISTIWQKIVPSISNNMWPHVFRSKVGSYFPYFLVMNLYIIFSSHMWQLYTYFGDRKVLEYTVCWFPIETNQLQPEYNISIPIQNQIQNTTWRSISKIAYSNQATSIALFRFFDWNWIQRL